MNETKFTQSHFQKKQRSPLRVNDTYTLDTEHSFADLPSTLSKKFCTFGYGKKQPFSQYQEKQALYNPGPGVYLRNQPPRRRCQSFTRQNRFNYSSTRNGLNPGPGSYNLSSKAGQHSKQFSLYSRLPALKDQICSPSPLHYRPKLQLPTRFQQIGIGYGQKTDFSRLNGQNPAPNAYHIKGKFDI